MDHLLQAAFFAIVGYFFISYLLQIIVLARLKKPQPQSQEEGISVVVCAHNEEENLKELIPLLQAQDYALKEIIIVDDRSHDGSYEYLIMLRPNIKHVRIDHVPDHANGKKFGLTMGIKAAKYDRIVFTDADCRPASAQWLSQMADAFTADKSFVLGYSQYEKSSGFLNYFIRFETITTAIHYMTRAVLFRPYMGVGRNLAYRKSVFMDNKGFGGMLKVTGGDDDLFVNAYAYRKSTAVVLSPDATVYSKPKKNFNDYYIQKKRHLSVGKYYRWTSKVHLALRAFWQLLFWAIFLLGISVIDDPTSLLIAFGVKVLMQGTVYWMAARKSGEKFDFWLWPAIDLMYSLYLATVGTIAGFSKKVKWS